MKKEEYVKLYTDKEKVYNNLYICMQRSTNEDIVRVPCSFPDVEAYLEVRFRTANGYTSAKVSESYLKAMGINKNDAIKKAFENVCADTVVSDLADVIQNPIANIKHGVLYVITNKECDKGAGCILNREVLDEIGLITNSTHLVCIPSSIHEWLVVPHAECFEPVEWSKMIHMVNTEKVSPHEQLGDKPYFVNLMAL